MLGDVIEKALSHAGVTKDRVEAWIGGPCNCRERQDKLNSLGLWAARVISGRIEGAKKYLESILDS